jgi:mRNA interferase MazF
MMPKLRGFCYNDFVKDFDTWNQNKKILDSLEKEIFFHDREVWWCKLGVNVGFEQDGKGDRFARPILIVKKFNNQIFWGVPLSTKIKKTKFYASIDIGDGEIRCAILSQMKLFDGKRLMDKIGVIPIENYVAIKKAIIALLE